MSKVYDFIKECGPMTNRKGDEAHGTGKLPVGIYKDK